MQDKDDIETVRCDCCEKPMDPTEKHIRLQTCTLWSGNVGQGVVLCKQCSRRVFEINTRVLDNA